MALVVDGELDFHALPASGQQGFVNFRSGLCAHASDTPLF